MRRLTVVLPISVLLLLAPFVSQSYARQATNISCYEDGITVSAAGIAAISGREHDSEGSFCEARGANFIVDTNSGKVDAIPHNVLHGDIKITRAGRFYLFPSIETSLASGGWGDDVIAEVDLSTKTIHQLVDLKGYTKLIRTPYPLFTFLDDGNILVGAEKDGTVFFLLIDARQNVVTQVMELPVAPGSRYQQSLGPLMGGDSRYYLAYRVVQGSERFALKDTVVVAEIDLQNGKAREIGRVPNVSLMSSIAIAGNFVYVTELGAWPPTAAVIRKYDVRSGNKVGEYPAAFHGNLSLVGQRLVQIGPYSEDVKDSRSRLVSWDAESMEQTRDVPIDLPRIASMNVVHDWYDNIFYVINVRQLVVVDVDRGVIKKPIHYTDAQ